MKFLSILLVLVVLVWAAVASESDKNADVQQQIVEQQSEKLLPGLVRKARQFGFGREREIEEIEVIEERRRPGFGGFGGRGGEEIIEERIEETFDF